MTTPKRPAHRPTSDNPASLLITIKATPEQKAKFLELGGSRWVKRLINEAIGGDKTEFERGFYEGFMASGEGFNSEYPLDVMTKENGYKAALREAIEQTRGK